jgi:hypothetical protein
LEKLISMLIDMTAPMDSQMICVGRDLGAFATEGKSGWAQHAANFRALMTNRLCVENWA